AGQTIVPKGKRRIGAWAKTFNFGFPEQGEVTTRLRDILETEVDEKYYLDEEKTAKLVAQLESANVGDQDGIEYDRRNGVGNTRDIALCLSSSDWRGLNRNQTQNAVAQSVSVPIREAMNNKYALEAKTPDERMSRQAIETFNESEQPKEHGDMIQAYNRQHLKDGICPTLTTRPEGFKTATLPVVGTEPQMLSHVDIRANDSIKRVYSPDGINPTLTTMGGGHREPEIAERRTCIDDTQGFDGVRLYDDETPSLRSSRSGLKVAEPKYRIRKLTPRECWRLQGFPD